jgi:hypothetical protein
VVGVWWWRGVIYMGGMEGDIDMGFGASAGMEVAVVKRSFGPWRDYW